VIFYHQTRSHISFWIDEATSREISEWNQGIQLTSRHIASLRGAVDSLSLEYSLKLSFIANKVLLEIARDTVGRATLDQLSKTFEAQQVSEAPLLDVLAPSSADQLREALNKSKAFLAEISPGYREDFINWKNWADSAAFSGRYTYEFFYPGGANLLSKGRDGVVKDTHTGEELTLDPWANVYDGPLAD
jgi:hypothetical protein